LTFSVEIKIYQLVIPLNYAFMFFVARFITLMGFIVLIVVLNNKHNS